eukprot:2434709-Rhodomonas_salina.2
MAEQLQSSSTDRCRSLYRGRALGTACSASTKSGQLRYQHTRTLRNVQYRDTQIAETCDELGRFDQCRGPLQRLCHL